MEQYAIRFATPADIPAVVRLRRLMFEAMGFDDPAELAAADRACEAYFARAIPAGEYVGWLAINEQGHAVASGGVVVDQHPPGPNNLTGRVGYIMNLSTEFARRRQGLARRIMRQIMDWIHAQGITVATLHATDVGRPLYAQFGFRGSNEMKAKL